MWAHFTVEQGGITHIEGGVAIFVAHRSKLTTGKETGTHVQISLDGFTENSRATNAMPVYLQIHSESQKSVQLERKSALVGLEYRTSMTITVVDAVCGEHRASVTMTVVDMVWSV